MHRLIIRRLAQALPLLLLVSVGVFALIQAVPGGPLTVYLSNPQVRPEDIARLERSLGLDRPVYVQYLFWLKGFLAGDWGFSYADGRPVLTRIMERIPATLELMTAGLVMAGLVAFPMGVIAAIKRNSAIDHLVTLITLFGISMPVYWMGLMLQLLFGLHLGWLPVAGRFSFGRTDWLDHLGHLILPAIVLAFVHLAVWSRYLRSSMIDVLSQPFITTARAKGLKGLPVIVRHALRNAVLPVLTIIILDFAFLLSGAVITESIFAWPGIGSLFVDSVFRRDYTVIMGVLMIGSAAVILANLAADIAYALVDPRVRYEGGR